MPSRGVHVAVATAGALVLISTATVRTQRRGNDNASFGMPVATNMILQDPDAYFGRAVTVTAGLEQVLSKTAFVVDQRKAVSATQVKAAAELPERADASTRASASWAA